MERRKRHKKMVPKEGGEKEEDRMKEKRGNREVNE